MRTRITSTARHRSALDPYLVVPSHSNSITRCFPFLSFMHRHTFVKCETPAYCCLLVTDRVFETVLHSTHNRISARNRSAIRIDVAYRSPFPLFASAHIALTLALTRIAYHRLRFKRLWFLFSASGVFHTAAYDYRSAVFHLHTLPLLQ